MVGSSEITWSFFPVSVGFSFIVIVLANGLVKKLRRSWALRTSELITIVTMGLVTSGIPIFIVGTLLSIPSKPYYGATPENQWAVFLQPYLPEWIIPSPDNDAMRYFYEGSPRGMPEPFDAWLGPLAWWLSIIFAVYFLCFCVVVLMRRQWADNERLVFPVTEVPRLLAEDQPGRSLPPILNSRAFWIGCAVPLGIILFNAISFWHPGFPRLDVHRGISFSLFPGAPDILLRLYFPVIGFVYLIATPISFSVWFFYLLLTAEAAVANWAGLTVTPDAYIYSPTQALSWQCGGAFAAMVVWGFWMARRHLRAVLRSVFRGTGELDDSREMCSYRLAVIGGIAAAVYILAWFWKSGIDLYIAVLLLASVMIVYVGMTRLAVQSGVLYITATFSPQALTTAVAGDRRQPARPGRDRPVVLLGQRHPVDLHDRRRPRGPASTSSAATRGGWRSPSPSPSPSGSPSASTSCLSSATSTGPATSAPGSSTPGPGPGAAPSTRRPAVSATRRPPTGRSSHCSEPGPWCTRSCRSVSTGFPGGRCTRSA